MLAGFQRFGFGHLSALGLTALASWALVRYGRSRRDLPAASAMADSLAFLLVAAFVADPIVRYADGQFDLAHSLPLQLCDAAGFAAIVALGTGRAFPFELAYYWGLSGTVQALLTPTTVFAFPHPDTVRYFVLHSGIVVAVFYLGPGLGHRPRRGSVTRVFLATLAYAALIAPLDWLLGANYMWLCEKPEGSLLDLFGPWPLYLAGGGAIGLALFFLLDLPYRFTGYADA